MKWDNSFSGIEYYSNVKSSSVEWIWYPYIPCGKITVLQGDPGEGKSTLILHIAAILTKDATLPDGNKIQMQGMIWKVCDWSENATYRIAGTHYPEYNLVEFDLKQAVVVQVGES